MEEFEKLVAESFESEPLLETKSVAEGAGTDSGPSDPTPATGGTVSIRSADAEVPAEESIPGEDDSAA
jgi:hypothetical protein